VRYVLVDDGPTFPASASDARDVRSRLKELGFRLVFAREGVKLYRR